VRWRLTLASGLLIPSGPLLFVVLSILSAWLRALTQNLAAFHLFFYGPMLLVVAGIWAGFQHGRPFRDQRWDRFCLGAVFAIVAGDLWYLPYYGVWTILVRIRLITTSNQGIALYWIGFVPIFIGAFLGGARVAEWLIASGWRWLTRQAWWKAFARARNAWQQGPSSTSSGSASGYATSAPPPPPPPRYESPPPPYGAEQEAWTDAAYDEGWGLYDDPRWTPLELRTSRMAMASVVIGLISLLTWLLPIVGIPLSLAGVIVGGIGRYLPRSRALASAGIALSFVGLVASLISALVGYLRALG
jgi:hypothetical protein